MISVLAMNLQTMHWSRKQSHVSFYVEMNSNLSNVCNRFSILYVEVIHLIWVFNSSRYIFAHSLNGLAHFYFIMYLCLFLAFILFIFFFIRQTGMRTFDEYIAAQGKNSVEKNNIARYKTVYGKAIQHFWYVLCII